MYIPLDIINLITDYYVSMQMHELKQRMNTEFHKNLVVCHMKSFHETTLTNGVFCHRFCLAVLKFMRINHMVI